MDIKKIEDVNIGRRAQLVIEDLKPILDECKTAILSEMKIDYRAGNLDQTKVFSKIAGLCILDEIEQRLKSRILKGNRAAKELHNE